MLRRHCSLSLKQCMSDPLFQAWVRRQQSQILGLFTLATVCSCVLALAIS